MYNHPIEIARQMMEMNDENTRSPAAENVLLHISGEAHPEESPLAPCQGDG
jgi:hypothetical protein